MIKKDYNKLFFKKSLLVFLLFLFVFSFSFVPKKAGASDLIGGPIAVVRKVLDWVEKNKDKLLVKVGSKMFQSALQVSLQQIAYDSAVYLGTGLAGQEATWPGDYWTTYAENIGDAAVGELIDTLGKEWDVNLCEPNLSAKVRIGFGLVSDYNPVEPKCTMQNLKNNWTSEFDRLKSFAEDKDNWINAVADSFDPTGNEIGTSMSLMGKVYEKKREVYDREETQLSGTGGWLDVRSLGGKQESVPGHAEGVADQSRDLTTKTFGETTGDIFVDTANIFLNQFLISLVNSSLQSLRDLTNEKTVETEIRNPFSESFTSAEGDPYSGVGSASMKDKLQKILTPKSKEKTDYSIIADLITCNGEGVYTGPSNCVISQTFSKAIENKNTVVEAINNGYISSGMPFSMEGDYKTALNERSLMILRKFRVVPIGWEKALIEISKKEKTHGGQYTIMDMISCFDGKADGGDQYSQFSKNFPVEKFKGDFSWCRGLVDPNWVLKAPLNYCAKQGYGGHVLSTQVVSIPAVGEEEARDDILVTRSDSYCADERSCIKEMGDGSCQFYGYCTEEKRIWNFDSESCPPVYNTCQYFTSSSGKKIALLKNTIDYNFCSADSSGCSIYSKIGGYNNSGSSVNWSSSPDDLIYFNSKAESCSGKSEGCNEFIRTKSGFGHNFIRNGDFEEEDKWGVNDIIDDIGYDGGRAIEITSASSLTGSAFVGPENSSLGGETFTFSFYSTCSASSTMSVGSSDLLTVSPSSDFIYHSVSYTYADSVTGNSVPFSINPGGGSTCIIDQLKLEKGSVGTFYSDYRGNALTYFKTIPDYLRNACYVNYESGNFKLKDGAPDACNEYARLCNFNELGCDLFKSKSGRNVAAKAMDKDYCPDECVGYDVYVQKPTTFESDYPYRLIPESARKCSVNNVACTQFTNLEDVASGGERVEYYSYLRQCIKPDEGTCSNFYSWEGNDESGYQLKSFNLASDNSIPKLTSGSLSLIGGSYKHTIDDVDVCSGDIYKYSISDPRYNPDCREFYTQSGVIIYALHTNTISCSNNCKLFRMTDKNIDRKIKDPVDCTNLNVGGKKIAFWGQVDTDDYENENVQESKLACFHCLNGGIWDDNQKACLYKAIPGEGKPCSASENGCREYAGNSGNNIKILDSYDFEKESSGWIKYSSSEVASVSSASLENGGKSLSLTAGSTVEKSLGKKLERGKSYVVSFLAKTSSNATSAIEISFENGSGGVSRFAVISTSDGSVNPKVLINGSSWQVYRANLENLDHDVLNDEIMVIKNTSASLVNIDDLVLSEINNKYYLIKDSWTTPNICYYSQINEYKGANYNLGCASYTDRANKGYNLRQFSKLCDSSAVGCELMVDTNNYKSKEKGIFVAGELREDLISCDDNNDCLEVPADKFSLVVYDQKNLCNPVDKGCSLMGKAASNIYSTSANYLYQNVYIKNNPDKYQAILCEEGAIGCKSWDSSLGLSYFKDPMDNICQFNNGKWYAKEIKRCVSSSIEGEAARDGLSVADAPEPCMSDSDCVGARVCKLDKTSYLCPMDNLKTIGNEGSKIEQPSFVGDVSWAGLCPINESGCTEYIDPESSFNSNLVLNSEFSDIDEDGRYFDGWNVVNEAGIELSYGCSISDSGSISCDNSSPSHYFRQDNYFVEKNKLYIIKYKGLEGVKMKCKKGVYQIDSSNSLVLSVADSPSTEWHSLDASAQKMIFYSNENEEEDCSFMIEVKNNANVKNISIEWRESVVDYKIRGNLDFKTCSGSANFNNGCILFNERAIASGGYPGFASFNYDSRNYSSPTSSNDGYRDANKIIKVRPDRICGKWLSCYSYITQKDEMGEDKNVCLQVGQCTSIDSSGNCLNFVKSPTGNRVFDAAKDANVSGYALLDNYYLDNMTQEGGDVFGPEDFEGGALGRWERKETSSSSPSTPTNSCLISKATDLESDEATSIVPVYPSPSNYKFVRVGGEKCDWLWKTKVISAKTETDYYLNFYINAANFKLQSGDPSSQVVAKIIGVDKNNKEEEGAVFKADLNRKDWQRHTLKFTTSKNWEKGFKIVLQPGDNEWVDNGWLYFDDINVAPALKVSDSKYVSPVCRLYPMQDSVSCYSDTGGYGFIEQGWEGYCLQKDPANGDVCLLWYPVDAVVGSAGSNLSTAFNGYAKTGPTPYYCAQMKADFDFVEYRDALFSDNLSFSVAGILSYQSYHCHSNCDDKNTNYIKKFIGKASSTMVKNSDENYDVYETKGSYKEIDEGVIASFKKVNAVIALWGFPNGSCSPETKCIVTKFRWMEPRVDPDNILVISIKGEPIYAKSLKSGRVEGKYTCCGSANPTSCSHAASSTLDCNNNRYTVTASNAGWYEHDGSLKVSPEKEKGLRLLAYNISKVDCEGGLYDWGSGNNEVKAVHYNSSNGCSKCGLVGACLMKPEKYNPKCSSIVQGIVPWAQRLKSSSKSLYDYNNDLPAHFKFYFLGSENAPYGAINTLSDPAGSSVFVNKISDNPSYNLYGLPYSCTGSGCKHLSLNNGKIEVSESVNTSNYEDDFITAKEALKYVFAQTLGFQNNYSHLSGGFSAAPTCNTNGCPTRNESIICSVWPEIKNIKISGAQGTLSQTKANSNVYAIGAAGYYTISFNTIVDSEQAPIKNISVKIKRETDDWNKNNSISLSNLDHKPNENDPHKLVKFLTPGNYIIAIKLVDNWDFYRCSGIAGFNPVNSGGNTWCNACCKKGLDKNDICKQCPESSFAGNLFSCPQP